MLEWEWRVDNEEEEEQMESSGKSGKDLMI